ncbi:MAG: DUF3048 domain-containing protein [Halanaerobiales bacterium]|nr:DUF3048 domain-containing protein [Halanaerobiales bacterium]
MKRWLLYGLIIILLIVGFSAVLLKDDLDDLKQDTTESTLTKKTDQKVDQIVQNKEQKETEGKVEDEVEDLDDQKKDQEEDELKKEVNFSKFTYLPLEDNTLHRAVMVSVENTPKARPQSGLDKASIVYEFLVEGGITRFLALYWSEIPDKIGPIRSLRPYMIEIAEEYDSLLLHAGASPDGFQYLEENNIKNLDQIYNGKYYWRSQLRKSPHNLYTGLYRIDDYLENMVGIEYEYRFNFADIIIISNAKKAADLITINYWGSYQVLYEYDQNQNLYYRYIKDMDNPHKTENGNQLSTNNIIIQFTETKVKDKIGRLTINLEGQNKALYFRNGVVTEGYWKKEDGAMTKFYDQDNNLITLNPGKTWIQIVPLSTNISYQGRK